MPDYQITISRRPDGSFVGHLDGGEDLWAEIRQAPQQTDQFKVALEAFAERFGVPLQVSDHPAPQPVNTREDGWAALAMIRETIETLGPPGAIISQEAVLAKYGPEYQHEAQAICDGLSKLLADARVS